MHPRIAVAYVLSGTIGAGALCGRSASLQADELTIPARCCQTYSPLGSGRGS